MKRERNRLAAEKYRKKNRELIVKLSDECSKLEQDNRVLEETNKRLEDQVKHLKDLLTFAVPSLANQPPANSTASGSDGQERPAKKIRTTDKEEKKSK